MKNHQAQFLRRMSWMTILLALVLITSCEQEEPSKPQISQNDKDQIKALGFSIDQLRDLGEFYLVEQDILLRKDKLYEYQPAESIEIKDSKGGRTQQIRVSELVSLENQRNITVFIDNSIPTTGDDNWRAEVQQAINEINAIPFSRIRMQLVTAGPADITVQSDETQPLPDGEWVWTGLNWVWTNWVVAAAEWPAGGNAGFRVRINLDTDNNRIFNTAQKLHNMAHEFAHCLSFRHTNWSGLGEASGIPVPNTPNSGDNPDPNSVMNGGTPTHEWSGFTSNDRVAFSTTYPHMTVNVSGPAKGWNDGTYTWSVSASNGIAPYSYEWFYSFDGQDYDNEFGTGTSITAQLPLDFDLYLMVIGTASDGETNVDYHFTMNQGDRPRPSE